MIVRCILAASTLESGKAAAKPVMAAVAAHRKEFEFDHHCGGPNLDATPNDVIGRIERYSGVKLADAFFDPGRRSRGEVALQICPPERYPRVAHFHDRRPDSDRYEQWRPDHRLGVAPFRAVIASTEGGRLSRAAGVRIVRSAGLDPITLNLGSDITAQRQQAEHQRKTSRPADDERKRCSGPSRLGLLFYPTCVARADQPVDRRPQINLAGLNAFRPSFRAASCRLGATKPRVTDGGPATRRTPPCE